MKARLQFTLKLSLVLLASALLESCAPPQVKNKIIDLPPATERSNPTLPAEPIDYELVPTDWAVPHQPKSSEIKYEKPVTEIKTSQTVLHLNQVKMSKVALTYDRQKHLLGIKGIAIVIDETGRLLAENSFSISGQSKDHDLVITLANAPQEKVNSNLKPVIRAQATCLGTTKNDEPDCSRVIIDFFIAYKQKVYTEQMEIKPTETTPAQPQPPVPAAPQKPPTVEKKNSDTDFSETSELQKEESENSVPGRFEGQADAVDLTKVFDKDDEIQKILKPKSEPIKPLPAPAPKDKSAGTTEKDKNEKAITDDLAQTKSGDLRLKNQAFGFPDEGLLKNATSLLVTQKNLNKKSFFDIVFPGRERYFATYEMAEMLTRMGERLHIQYNKNLAISDISKVKGGLLSPHLSHQIGMDADIAYPSTSDQVKFPVVVDMHTRRFNPNSFSIAKTFDLLKFAYQQDDLKIDRIFIDRMIKASLCEYAKAKGELTGSDKTLVQHLFKSIEHVNGHGDHFHLRLKCTSAHPGCRKKNYVEVAGCS